MVGKYISRLLTKIIFVLLGLVFSQSVKAQFDTEFWMPPIWDVSNTDRNSPSSLVISTPFSFPVTINVSTLDGTTFNFTGTVTSGTPLVVPLTPVLGQTNVEGVPSTQYGLRVTSSAPIQCVHRVSGGTNQTLVTLKGTNALGREFFCGSQVRNLNSNYGPEEYHFISVMAIENNTQVTFQTPFTMYGTTALPNPHTVTLQAGQSYLIRGNSPVEHVCGARVTSNRDIVVNSGSTHTRISGAGANAADGGTDQLVPVGLAGTEWVCIKGNNNFPWDYSIIVATQNNTNIYIDGSATPAATINAGQFFDWTMTGAFGAPHYFRTDRPAYCYHVSGCSVDEEVDMSAMPEISCTGSRYIEFSRFNIPGLFEIMQLLIQPTAAGTLTINGTPFTAFPGIIIQNVPGLPGWRAATIPNANLPLNVVVQSQGFFHAGWLTGNGATGAYGYLSGFDDAFEFQDPSAAEPIPTTIYNVATLCQGQSVDHCLRVFSCGNNNFIDSFSGNEGNIIIAPPSAPHDTCFRYTAPFNFVGRDTVTFVIENEFGFQGSLDLIFTVVNPNTPINAGADQFVCGGSTATLTAVNPDPLAVGFWTVASGTGVLANPNSPTTTVSNLSLGQNSFIWTQSYPWCSVNRVDLIQITRFQGTPPAANAGPDANLCSTTTYTMQANDPGTAAIGTWSITSGTATIQNINSATTQITNLGVGINTFVWNISNGPCPGGDTNDEMVIRVFNNSHPPANAGPDQTVCQGAFTLLNLTANTPIVPATGSWSVIQGTGTFANASAPNTTVTGLSIGVNRFRWTINNGPCGTLTDEIVITVFNPSSPAANAGADQTVCLPNNSTTLAANSPIAPATGTWSVVSGTGSFSSVNDPNATVSGLSLGQNRFRWTMNNGPCAGAITVDDVIITVFPDSQPAANAGPDQTFCFTNTPITASINGNAPTAPGTGQWTLVSGTGTIAPTGPTSATVSGLSLGNNVFQWTLSNGSCDPVVSDQMTITVFNGNISTTNAGPDATICLPTNTFTMAATAPAAPATGFWTQVSGPGGASINTPTSPATTISNLSTGTFVFRWTIQNGACGNTVFDEMTINVFNANAQIANAGPDQLLCFTGIAPGSATMAANAAIAPSVGTWTLVSGSGVIVSPNSPTTTINNLAVGINIFRWTINNGTCGSTNDLVAIFVFSSSQTQANAGPDQQICSNAPSANLAGNSLISPATGTWSQVSGPNALTIANPTSPTTSVSGFVPGIYTLQWTVNNGPCATPVLTSDQMTITVFPAAQTPANAGADQSICNTTSSITLTGNSPIFPTTGQWTVVSGSGTFSNPTSPITNVTGLGVGINCFRWTINTGVCAAPTFDEVCVTVFDNNAPAANAGPDLSFCLPITSATMAANNATFPAVGLWTLVSGTGTIVSPNSPTTQITGLSLGSNTFRWTINNGTCGTITFDEVTVVIFDNNQGPPNAGPDAQLCTPTSTYTMQGSAVTSPATGQWTLLSGTGTIANASQPNASISGLGIGSNVFRWTILNGPCPAGQNFDDMTIFVFDENQPSANAGPDQNLCFTGIAPVNTVMSASSVVAPGTGQWTIIQGSGTIVSASSPTTAINNLGVGQNIFRWTVNNGPCANGVTFDEVSIFVFSGAQAAANAGPDQELCSTNPSTTLAANSVIFPGTGSWSIVQGTAVFASATNPTTAVSGLSIGTNILRWTINNGPCNPSSTFDDVTIVVFNNAQLPANAGADFSACTSQGPLTLTGTPFTFPATGQWALVSGSGTIATPNASTTLVSNLGVGTNIFSYTIFNGPCAAPSVDQIVITEFSENQTAANAGADQNICLPTTSTTLTGNALIAPATGQWTLIQGSGTIVSPTSATTAVTGLAVGENIFRWTVSNGPCDPSVTFDQVSIFVFSNIQPAANAGADQSFCEPVSSTTLTANNAIFPATGLWTWVSGPVAPNIVSPTSASTLVTGLGVGANVFRWTITNGPCVPNQTFDEITILIFDRNQPAANAGPDQNLCSPTFTTQLQGNNALFPATGQWTLISGTGTISNASSPTSTVSGLSIGENIFRWTISNGPCTNSVTFDEVSIFVFDSNAPVANAGPDQSICTPASSVVMAANSAIFPGTGQWSLVSGSGTIVSISNPTTTIANLPVGVHTFRWTITNGACGSQTTFDDVVITVFSSSSPSANAGPDQDLCTPITSTTLNGSAPIFPSTGTWTLVSGTGTIVDPTNPASPVAGLSIGPNVFRWTVQNGPCANALTFDEVTITIFNGGAAQPNAGIDQELCSPTSSTTLAAEAAVFPGIGAWSVVQGTGTFSNINNPNATVSGLSIGVNIFRWTVNYSTCGSPSDDVSIIVYNSAQGESNAGADQTICTPQNTVTLAAAPVLTPGFGTWSVAQGSGSFVDVNNPSTVVTNLAVGENILVWTVYNGPCLAAPLTTDSVSIWMFDQNNPIANAGADQQFCTPTSSTTVQGSSLIFPASGVWSVVQGSANITTPNNPTTNVTGLTVGETILRWTVSNGNCLSPITQDDISIFIFDQNQANANAGADQELCSTGNAPVNTTMAANALTFPATGAWALVAGGGNIVDPTSPTTAITDLPVGENIFSWTISNGPCPNGITTDFVSIFVFDNTNLIANAGADQEICLPNTSVVMQASNYIFPASGTWSFVQGSGTFANVNDPNTTVSNLAVGINIIRWTVDNGPCAAGITTDQVEIRVFDNNAPAANAGADIHVCEPTTSVIMNATIPAVPGVGVWTIIAGGSGVSISDINNPNATVSGFVVGETILSWSVYNGPCPVTNTSDLVSIFLYEESQPEANAGANQDICTPQTTTTISANNAIFPATGTWTLLSGSGTIVNPTSPTTEVTNLGVGANVFCWNILNGPCDPPFTTDCVTINVFDSNQDAAFAGNDQEFCLPTTSTTLVGSAVVGSSIGQWTIVQGGGLINNISSSTTSVTNMPQGENIFRWTVNNGSCGTTFDEVSVFIYNNDAPEADAGQDASFCTPVSTYTMQANTPEIPGLGTWAIEVGPGLTGTGTIDDLNNPNANISGLVVGENRFSWTIYNGPCEVPTIDYISIFIYDENQPAADAGEDQEICLPINSVDMAANAPIFPASGQWVLISGGGDITNPSSPTTSITNLPQGENIFQWTIDNGPCDPSITSDQVSIFVFDPNAPEASAGPDQEFCEPVSSTNLAALTPATPGVGTWTLVAGTGTIADINDPNTLITDLTVGENCFLWTVYNGPCEPVTEDQVCIYIFPDEQLPADAGEDQELCTPLISTQMEANAVTFPAVGQWSIIQGSADIDNIFDPNTVITNIAEGVNILQWTIQNGPCDNSLTSDIVEVRVYSDQNPLADAGPDQELCLPTNSTTVNGSALTAAATGLWTNIDGGGTIVDPTSPTTAITDMPIGFNTFVWFVDNGACGNSSDTITIAVFNPDEVIANAGEDASYCTPVSTHCMSASAPSEPAVGTWILITGTGEIENPNDPNTCINGLTVGENIFMWQIDNGPCGLTLDVMSIFIYNENTPDADAGPDIELCLPTTEVNMAASSAEFPAIGTWTVIEGPAIIGDLNSPTSLMTNLQVGENIFVWTVNNGVCPNGITSDTVVVRVFDPKATAPLAGPDQFICTPQSEVTMFGNEADVPSFGTWNITQGSATITNINNPFTTVTDLAVGINIFTWSFYNSSCGSNPVDDVAIYVYDQNQPPADAGPDQELCFPTTSTVMAGNDVIVPAIGTWTLVSGTATIAEPNNPNTAVSNLGNGTNVFVWTIDNGPCIDAITTDTMEIRVFLPDAPTAFAGQDLFTCTPINCIAMNAEAPEDPQTGTWSVVSSINGNGATAPPSFVDPTDPNSDLCNLVVGVHTVNWEIYNGPCNNNSNDDVQVFVYDNTAPAADAGEDIFLCSPESSTILNANAAVFPGVGFWSIESAIGPNGAITGGTFSDLNDPNATISDLQIGIYTLVWTIDNGPCGAPTTDTVIVQINNPLSPNADAGPDQEFCIDLTDAVMNANEPLFPAFGTWTAISFDPTGTIVDPSDPNTSITDIPLNEHLFVWCIDNGACANAVTCDTVSVYVNDATIAAAFAGDDLFFCGAPDSLIMQASIAVGLAEGLWTFNDNVYTFTDETFHESIVYGFQNGTNTFTWTVDNGACGISSDDITITVYDPELPAAYAGESDAICENRFQPFNLNATDPPLPANGWWTIVEGPIVISDSTDANAEVISLGEIIEELVDVPSTIVWVVDNGVCGITTDTVVYILEDCLTVEIPDAFSPNGDGVNDTFVIPNLESYPNHSLKIFNRWGAQVFEAAPYLSDWDGRSSHPATLGENLPVSTYYYILDLGNGEDAFRGFVYLKR